jgi:hypothetical protein
MAANYSHVVSNVNRNGAHAFPPWYGPLLGCLEHLNTALVIGQLARELAIGGIAGDGVLAERAKHAREAGPHLGAERVVLTKRPDAIEGLLVQDTHVMSKLADVDFQLGDIDLQLGDINFQLSDIGLEDLDVRLDLLDLDVERVDTPLEDGAPSDDDVQLVLEPNESWPRHARL